MSETYDLLLKRREEIRAWIAKAQADLDDVETALAAITPRQAQQPAEAPAPQPSPNGSHVEREDCPQCGQSTTRDAVLGGSWIHEATGLIPCQPAAPAGQTQTEGATR